MTAEQPVIWMRARPSGAGRPAQHSRAEITAAAIAIADRDGLDAVSMRKVAADLGTGAASLYRYLDTREDLLDLMTDAMAAGYDLPAPTGDWLADLVAFGEQARGVLRRHPWLPQLTLTRPALGPGGIRLLEHALDVLAPCPAPLSAKLEAFAMLNSVTATFVMHELAGGSAAAQRTAGYLDHALASGEFPRLTALLTEAAGAPGGDPGASPDPAGRYPAIMSRILAGLLAPG
jgi:AcrR family transcriptional regulator